MKILWYTLICVIVGLRGRLLSHLHCTIMSEMETNEERPRDRLKRILNLQYKCDIDEGTVLRLLNPFIFPLDVVSNLGILYPSGVLVVGRNQQHVDLIVCSK